MTLTIAKVCRVVATACGFALIVTALGGEAWATPTPEIDPASIIGAMTLLAGGLAMVLDRRRK